MLNIVAGTAGHIDHGKTSLVRALTGIDADRLQEEKRRGITIDLGFAHAQLAPNIRAGFIDVPGHEHFIKNMLSGIGGIDLVLLVVAANESIKPQTREHFEICRLLGIRSGIVVITKTDLVDPEIVDLVKLEIADFTSGSFLERSPIVTVSASTGFGIKTLKQELIAAAQRIRARDAAGFFRLPIDRAFSAKGFGTVVTGTLLSGTIAREQEVQLYPTDRRLRVRGLQIFGGHVAVATPGQRTAVNLAGIEYTEIERGMVLADPGTFTPVTVIDCSLELLGSAKPLKHRAPVHFHAGSAAIEAEIRILPGEATIQPGSHRLVRLMLRHPALLLPGDPFIIRMFSPVTTIGGGRVIDIGGVKYRKNTDVAARLRVLSEADPASRIALLVGESVAGVTVAELAARTGLPPSQLPNDIPGVQFLSAQDLLVDRAWLQSTAQELVRQVREFHRVEPLKPGISRQSLRAPGYLLDQLLSSAPELSSDHEFVRLRSHQVVLRDDEAAARSAIETAFQDAGLLTLPVGEVFTRSGVEPKRARSLLQMLIREKRLVKVSEELVFHSDAIAAVRVLLQKRKGERFGVAAFKDWTGVSRKYAIPLLEYFDRERITQRDGDQRVVV